MKIGIIGSSSASDKKIVKQATAIGQILAANKHTVYTGGVTGYPHMVATAAIKAGGRAIAYGAGRTIGDHYTYYRVGLAGYTKTIFQKKYIGRKRNTIDLYLRSLLMVKELDAIIVIGGRVGTMYELTIGSGLGKDVLILKNSGGITGRTAHGFIKEGHKSASKIVFFAAPEQLATLLK